MLNRDDVDSDQLAQALPVADLHSIRDTKGPITVDLERQRITGLCLDIGFATAPEERIALLEGLDDIGMNPEARRRDRRV